MTSRQGPRAFFLNKDNICRPFQGESRIHIYSQTVAELISCVMDEWIRSIPACLSVSLSVSVCLFVCLSYANTRPKYPRYKYNIKDRERRAGGRMSIHYIWY